MDSVGKWSTNGKGCGYGETCSPTDPVRGVCPEGWHLPTELEFDILIDAVGGWKDAGVMLKSTTGWKDRNGTGDFGFSAMPAGSMSGPSHYSDKEGAYFWSSTDSYHAAYRMGLHRDDELGIGDERADLRAVGTDYGLSVRCVKD